MVSVETSRKWGKDEEAGADASASRPRRRSAPDAEFRRWLEKYGPVERAIIEERARRFEAAAKRRARRRIAFGTECEATEGLAKVWGRHMSSVPGKGRGGPAAKRRGAPGRDRTAAPADGLPLARIGKTGLHVLDGGIVSVLLSIAGVQCTRDLDAMRHSLKRPLYYERENARRRALAAERRKVRRRSTTNPCPTREEVLDAWVNAKKSREGMLRFGGMMEDLECYVDNSLRFGRDGGIVGREAGIKGWLQVNIPALYGKYKTIMRYKAAARKLRQVVELRDPSPVSLVLGGPKAAGRAPETDGDAAAKGAMEGMGGNEIMLRTNSQTIGRTCENGGNGAERRGDGHGGAEKSGHGANEMELAALRARAVYLEAMEGVPDNATRTMERLDELLDPERVADATMLRSWKERYENEITMRTKSRWLKRLFGSKRKRKELMPSAM